MASMRGGEEGEVTLYTENRTAVSYIVVAIAACRWADDRAS